MSSLNIKFSEFDNSDELVTDSIIPISQSGSNKKVYPSAFMKLSNIYNAKLYGISPSNLGSINSQNLQNLIDSLNASGGGVIFIPDGVYAFESIGAQTIGKHCVKMKSNVSITGNGSNTILKPTGSTDQGLDMFYFNEYSDSKAEIYLENCTFSDFVIDGSGTSVSSYTSAGKGFMLNLIKNVHWENVTVKNTDATGFGVDCPIDCSIVSCIAENCGKSAQTTDVGASGFGIGFGFTYNENMIISKCVAKNCRKFGFFFEHQRRFSPDLYSATSNNGFMVCDCTGIGNYHNFGGIQAINAMYRDCYGDLSVQHDYFLQNSENCNVMNCVSVRPGDTSFVILADYTDGGTQENKDIAFVNCISKLGNYGSKIVNSGSTASMTRNIIKNCFFNLNQINSIYTDGNMQNLILHDNVSNGAENNFGAEITDFVNIGNTWN